MKGYNNVDKPYTLNCVMIHDLISPGRIRKTIQFEIRPVCGQFHPDHVMALRRLATIAPEISSNSSKRTAATKTLLR